MVHKFSPTLVFRILVTYDKNRRDINGGGRRTEAIFCIFFRLSKFHKYLGLPRRYTKMSNDRSRFSNGLVERKKSPDKYTFL